MIAALALLLAPPPQATAQAPPTLAFEALDLVAHGRATEGWETLVGGLAAWADGPAADDGLGARRAARLPDPTPAALARGPERAAALDREWPRESAPDACALVDRARLRALVAIGDAGGARALSDELGFVTDWKVVGPFDNERGGGFAVEHPPEIAIDLEAPMEGKERAVAWRDWPAPDAPSPTLDLGDVLAPSQQAVAYLATAVRAGEARAVELRLASSCAFKVFVDGREVALRAVERPLRPDQDRVRVELREGWTQLLLELGVEEGPWEVEARLCELDGSPARGLAVDSARVAEPPEPGASARDASALLPGPVAELAGAAEMPRAVALYHLLAHPDDFSDRSALDPARRAVAADEEDVLAHHLLVWALDPAPHSTHAERATAERLDAMRALLAIDPCHFGALGRSIEFYLEEAEIPSRASRLSERALTCSWGTVFAFHARSRALAAQGRGAEARAMERLAATSDDGRLLAWSAAWRADDLIERGEVDAAREVLAEALERRLAFGDVFDRAFRHELDRGDPDRALRLLERALVLDPTNAAAMTAYGERLEHAGRLDGARALYERALAVAPERTEPWSALVRLDLKEGREEDAIAGLEEVVRLDPGDDAARRHLSLLVDAERERFELPWRWDALELVDLPLPAAGGNDPLEVLDRTTVWRVHSDGTEHRYEHLAARVLHTGGVKSLDALPIRYPSGARLLVYEARVVHPDGTFERAPAPSGRDPSGDGFRMRVLDLPPLSVGDVVDLEYRVDQREPGVFGEYFGTRHEFYPEEIDRLAPTRRSELVVIAPEGTPLQVVSRNAEGMERSIEVRTDGTVVRRFVVRDLERPPVETGMPRRSELSPAVDVTSYESWDAFASWWWSLIEKEFVTTPAMRAKVAELVEGIEDERARIEAIARFVGQEIRYNSWPFGPHGYEPFSAATIFERRFGDCKDKSILLRQMLAEIGVEAHPVLVKAEYRRADEPLDAALVEHFNHCIAWLPPTEGREGLYLDATSDRNPIGYLRADDQGARVLHVTPGGGELRTIPYAPPEGNRLDRRWELWLGPRGAAEVALVDESRGQFGVRLRHLFGGETGELETRVARELAGSHGSVDVIEATTSDLDDIGEPARLEARFRVDSAWTVEGDGALLRLGFDPLGIEDVAVETPEDRRFDLVLDRPYSVRTHVVYHLPEGARLARTPPAVEIAAEGLFTYRQESRPTEDGVEVVRELALLERRIPRSDYARFRDALREVRRAEDRSIEIVVPPEPEAGG